MRVAAFKTVEGDEPVAEVVRTELGRRVPRELHPRTRLVIRDYQASGVTTASLEALRIE